MKEHPQHQHSLQVTRCAWSFLLKEHYQRTGRSVLHSLLFHHDKDNGLALATAFLTRLLSLRHNNNNDSCQFLLLQQLLLQGDYESNWTALHVACYQGNLYAVLLLLRVASVCDAADNNEEEEGLLLPTRGGRKCRPMNILYQESSSSSNVNNSSRCSLRTSSTTTITSQMMMARDYDGHTPVQLLTLAQRTRLDAVRHRLGGNTNQDSCAQSETTSSSDSDDDDDDSNEFAPLAATRQRKQWEQQHHQQQQSGAAEQHGCEVLTFGRAHHCALGVASSSDNKVRPQRVGALEAVAVAGAQHHSLVVTVHGHLYAFGLGKGGRLGLGNNEDPCARPERVTGLLRNQHICAVAAAENHSLCVSRSGAVFAWGSNRFGQVGGAVESSSTSSSSCHTPRRMEDLRHTTCVAVAAGERHSVALSSKGEVYVWGDNSSGQLALNRRNGTHRVQRVESLWTNAINNTPKRALSISASAQATLVLTAPGSSGLPVNAVYAWGHGSNVPSRVRFPSEARLVDPVSIACARHHNAAITADGRVFTWGLHVEALGTKDRKKTPIPQLVTGMLPANGGGVAVALSASENHTAVVTDTGELYTWGATHGKNVLGHEGVRWQPDPKRVPGVSRAVAVAAAKEHTILLAGSTFPCVPRPNDGTTFSLENLAAQTACRYVDMFNVLPVLAMAERIDNALLRDFACAFVKNNLDGVLNVCQKSCMNTLLSEKLSSLSVETVIDGDEEVHPLLLKLILPPTEDGRLLRLDSFPPFEDWIETCREVCEDGKSAQLLTRLSESQRHRLTTESVTHRTRSRSVESVLAALDLGSEKGTEKSVAALRKAVRSLEKRLGQISKLEDSQAQGKCLQPEEEAKVMRRKRIEDDLRVWKPALRQAETKLDEMTSVADTKETACDKLKDETSCTTIPEEPAVGSAVKEVLTFQCKVCNISCTDRASFDMHLRGRKHRNKLALKEENEKQEAADKMLAERQSKQLLESSSDSHNRKTRQLQVSSQKAWMTKKTLKGLPFTLPPPPHPVPSVMAVETPTTPNLRQIMDQQNTRSVQGVPRKAPVSQESPKTRNQPSKNSFPLGDFITPSSTASKSSLPGSWASANSLNTCTVAAASAPTVMSLAEIQKQEESFLTQAEKRKSGGKWYVERRPRAGSFKEIELETESKRQHDLLVQEQLYIEKQIMEERRHAARKQQQRKRKPKGRKRDKKNRGDQYQSSDNNRNQTSPRQTERSKECPR